ncbi:MAG: hypothetical protein AAF694_06410 [Bacteroidota bacterium]
MTMTSKIIRHSLPMLMILFSVVALQAQGLGLTANFSKFNIDRIQSEVADIDYAGSTSLVLNARIFTKKNWAWRIGAGVDNLSYTVGGGVSTDYQARRKDLKAVIGLEKHFMLGNWIDLYPGVYVPITVTGEDVIDANLNNLRNGDTRAGMGVVLGANIGFLKILRVGVEFDATFDNFRNTVYESVETTSVVPFKGLKRNTSITLGVRL